MGMKDCWLELKKHPDSGWTMQLVRGRQCLFECSSSSQAWMSTGAPGYLRVGHGIWVLLAWPGLGWDEKGTDCMCEGQKDSLWVLVLSYPVDPCDWIQVTRLGGQQLYWLP